MTNKNTIVKDIKHYRNKFWKLIFYSIGVVVLFFTLAYYGFFGSMPSFEDLENPDSNLATEILSSDGVLLGKYYNENRMVIKYEDLPPHLVNALVATEDERFYEHSGIDAKRTIGATLKLGSNGGASTLTQQLAKLLFHGEGSNFKLFRVIQKIKEWIIAIKLERQYTKNEIIAMYLNKVDFVNTAVGIRSASKVYFGKEPRKLTIDEAAMFVGMLKNPSYFNPLRRIEKVKNRRNTVLGQMVRNGILDNATKEKLSMEPIVLNFHPENHNEGTATYFREYLRDYMKKWMKENKKPDGSDYNIYGDGLKIYTTLDSKIQEYAEEAVQAHIKNLQTQFFVEQRGNSNAPFINLSKEQTNNIMKAAMRASERWRVMKEEEKSEDQIIASFNVKTKMKIFSWKGELDTIMTPMDSIRYYKHFLQAGLMSMEPKTGHIKAWVGGINYKYFQYDHVGQGARQVGSTFKPFVYATAFEQQGMTPCDNVVDSPVNINGWRPKNSDHRYRGSVNLKTALAYSINTISAKLIDRVGVDAVIALTRKLGVKSKIPRNATIALGTAELTVKEMVGAYSTFANQGVYIEPQFISRIEDKNGNSIYEPTPVSHDVLNRDIAYSVIKLLEGVTEIGSGARLRRGGVGPVLWTGYPYAFTNEIAGKTGTTQNQSDGWFIGMVPNLATGVWVGCEDRSARFKSITYGQGAAAALPIWGYFMKKCYQDKKLLISEEDFEKPDSLTIELDCWKKESRGGTWVGESESFPDENDPDLDELEL